MVPKHYKKHFCHNPKIDIITCDYVRDLDCPKTCHFAQKYLIEQELPSNFNFQDKTDKQINKLERELKLHTLN